MKNITEFKYAAKEALISCLQRVPFLSAEEVISDFQDNRIRSDFLVKVRLKDREKVLIVELKKNGQPRFARDAVNQLQRYLMNNFAEAYGLFMAPYISSSAAEICREGGIGYLDLAGNCRICFDSVYIEQDGRPNPFSEKKDLRSLYSPKAERILRVLLNRPKKAWKTKNLAEEAEVSFGQVANVKKLLLDREWIVVTESGFVLTEPELLLQEWKENHSYRKSKIYDFYSLKNIPQIETDISEYCQFNNMRYAFTGFSGAVRFAPSVRYNRTTAYIEDIDEDMKTELSLKEVDSGANVSLLVPYDDGVFYDSQDIKGLKVVSPVQLYLDVIGFRGRGEEAAQALLEQTMRSKW